MKNLLRGGRSNLTLPFEMTRRENLRRIVASSLLAALVFALGLAVSPQLHARLHPDADSPSHECAVTLIATGKYEQADAPPLVAAPQPAVVFEKIPALVPVWVAAPFLGARFSSTRRRRTPSARSRLPFVRERSFSVSRLVQRRDRARLGSLGSHLSWSACPVRSIQLPGKKHFEKISAISFALISRAHFASAQVAATSPSPSHARHRVCHVWSARIVVTGGEIERSSTDTAQAVTVLNEDQLKAASRRQPRRYPCQPAGRGRERLCPGASRPIIRGLADNRVRVLNDGTEVFDVSNLSPDHAPSVSPLVSQSIEIVRGPVTILFGSGAIGGVVNVVDNRIPVEVPPEPLSGEFDARFASGDLERSVAGEPDIALTNHFVLHLDGSFLRTDSRRIPGFALDDRIRLELPRNSALLMTSVEIRTAKCRTLT